MDPVKVQRGEIFLGRGEEGTEGRDNISNFKRVQFFGGMQINDNKFEIAKFVKWWGGVGGQCPHPLPWMGVLCWSILLCRFYKCMHEHGVHR